MENHTETLRKKINSFLREAFEKIQSRKTNQGKT